LRRATVDKPKITATTTNPNCPACIIRPDRHPAAQKGIAMIEILVFGLPAPQGSKSFKGIRGGKAILTESSKNVKPWREAVKWAAMTAREDAGYYPGSGRGPCISGAVVMDVTFTLPRPKSAKRGAVPSKKPDLSKLVRSTEDALTDSGAWEDDARVVDCRARKVYPGEHPDALDVPGAVIRISEATA
jgi:Holliday junction resolvase RusA-like endonuclease